MQKTLLGYLGRETETAMNTHQPYQAFNCNIRQQTETMGKKWFLHFKVLSDYVEHNWTQSPVCQLKLWHTSQYPVSAELTYSVYKHTMISVIISMPNHNAT